MNKIFLLFCFCNCCLLSFGQEIVLEADFERERQAFIDKLNPVFAKIRYSYIDSDVRIILKSDKVAISNFYEHYYQYYRIGKTTAVDTIIQVRNNKNQIKDLRVRESVHTYRKTNPNHWFYETSLGNKKIVLDRRAEVITQESPVYAKIDVLTENGLEREVILKSDSLAVATFNENIDKYDLVDRELVHIQKVTTTWAKQPIYSNCMGFGVDCLIWTLIPYEVDTFISIDIYQYVTKEAADILQPDYYSETLEHKINKRQKAINKANPIYAKIQEVVNDSIKEIKILKNDSLGIWNIENQDGLILYDIETVDIKTSITYWTHRITNGCNCKGGKKMINGNCLIWCLVEQPIQTTEIIEIYRQQPIIENLPEIIKTDIAKASRKIDFKVYPNPFLNTITIEAEGEINSVKVFNQNGQILLEKKWNVSSQTLDLSHLPNGFYYLKVIGEDFQETVKLEKF